MVYNEERGEYLPTYGYKNQGKKDKDLSNWVVEVDGTEGTPPITHPISNEREKIDKDPFEKQREEKKQRIAKNEMQQRRNREEGQATLKGMDPKTLRKQQLRASLIQAKKANASAGVFDGLDDGVKLKQGKRKVLMSSF